MRSGLCYCLTAVLLLFVSVSPALAAVESQQMRKALIRAEKFYRAGKQRSFTREAEKISDDSVYQPLLRYRAALLALSQRSEQLELYITRTTSPYLRAKARDRLLEHYAKNKEWHLFANHAAHNDCAAALLALRRAADEAARAEAAAAVQALWQQDRRMDKSLCLRLYRYAYAVRPRVVEADDVWLKLRQLAGDKKLGPSRRLLRNFRGFVSYKKVRSVVRRATRYIRSRHGLNTRAGRELVMISAMVAVRRNPKTAITRWRQFSPYFNNDENDHVWTVLASWAARWHRDDALKLYEATTGKYADTLSRAWRVRAALRAGNDAEVLAAIDAMPPDEQQISAWRYWRASAAAALGDDATAQQALRELATDEDDFYGLLAREASGLPLLEAPPAPSAPAAVTGDFQLALALHQAGLKSLARAMWRHAARRDEVNDTERLAAAAAAAAAGWHLASIDAAIRAGVPEAYYWRFPLPYKEDILAHSSRRRLDPAFVYGLIHQESRFMPEIVSSAQARGLMQVIPRTARQVARANGYSRYRLSRLTRVDTNLTIGTTYLSELADTLAALPAKVAAGYNAGPGRVSRWYRASPQLLVAIENIPITETRLYVKYLLANRLHYTARLGYPLPSMQENIIRSIRVPAR